ncbi:MAG: DUF2064 domain-containing protein [Microthrixaceae bacterium]|nr:DUF2064 domain-containing protein [Microthrixaceae bacterium]
MSARPTVVVMAKAPRAGRSKTRLCPPCRPEQAAAVAEAALRDTLATVRATPGVARVVALDGPAGPWLPAGFDVVAQRGDGLGERLAHAVGGVDGPVVVIGMDTPQLDPATLSSVVRSVRPGRAVLGPADDGGWWVLGLHRAERHAFDGVPMSADDTGIRQAEQLRRCGLAVDPAPTLRDIDHWPDALAAAAATPGSRLAAAVAEVEASLVVAG